MSGVLRAGNGYDSDSHSEQGRCESLREHHAEQLALARRPVPSGSQSHESAESPNRRSRRRFQRRRQREPSPANTPKQNHGKRRGTVDEEIISCMVWISFTATVAVRSVNRLFDSRHHGFGRLRQNERQSSSMEKSIAPIGSKVLVKRIISLRLRFARVIQARVIRMPHHTDNSAGPDIGLFKPKS